jgi:hypothetical protein
VKLGEALFDESSSLLPPVSRLPSTAALAAVARGGTVVAAIDKDALGSAGTGFVLAKLTALFPRPPSSGAASGSSAHSVKPWLYAMHSRAVSCNWRESGVVDVLTASSAEPLCADTAVAVVVLALAAFTADGDVAEVDDCLDAVRAVLKTTLVSLLWLSLPFSLPACLLQ